MTQWTPNTDAEDRVAMRKMDEAVRRSDALLDDRAELLARLDHYGRNAAQREARHHIEQPSLPSATTTDLVTMTVDELHDVIYQAVSTEMQRTSMPKNKAQDHGARAALTGQQIVRAQGWTHRGVDPRE